MAVSLVSGKPIRALNPLRGVRVIFTSSQTPTAMSITLELSDEVTQRAEQYARQQGRSLTALVEDYLRQVVAKPATAQPLAPVVAELYGILSLPAGFDYKTQREEPAL